MFKIRFQLIRLILLISQSPSYSVDEFPEAEVLRIIRSQAGMPLGGNMEGSRLISLPDGRRAVFTTRRFWDPNSMLEVGRTIQNIRTLSKQGTFANVLGTAHVGEGTQGAVYIMMEDMFRSSGGRSTIAAGGYNEISSARNLPLAVREDLRTQLLQKALTHPDGHLNNVMFRVVPIKNGVRVDVKQVDPYMEPLSFQDQVYRLTETFPPGMRQYDANVQNQRISALLDLPPAPHPDSMLLIADGYGKAQAAAQVVAPNVQNQVAHSAPKPHLQFHPKGLDPRIRVPLYALPFKLLATNEATREITGKLIDSVGLTSVFEFASWFDPFPDWTWHGGKGVTFHAPKFVEEVHNGLAETGKQIEKRIMSSPNPAGAHWGYMRNPFSHAALRVWEKEKAKDCK